LNFKKEELFIYLIYFVGLFGHLNSSTIHLMKVLTPFTLLVTGGLVLYFTNEISNKKFLMWLTLTYLITFSLEILGTHTGIIFGEYKYGATLGVKLFEVPLIIGFNWILIILGAIKLTSKISEKIFINALITGLFCVIFDLVLEPIAIKLDYWNWMERTIPLQNYLAWFLISFVFSVLLQKMKIEIKSNLIEKYVLTQFIFFLTLLIFL